MIIQNLRQSIILYLTQILKLAKLKQNEANTNNNICYVFTSIIFNELFIHPQMQTS